LQAHFPEKRLKSLYIKEEFTFEEVESFIQESILKYRLNNTTIRDSMKSALRNHFSFKFVHASQTIANSFSWYLIDVTLVN
jgi:hypothetical protein